MTWLSRPPDGLGALLMAALLTILSELAFAQPSSSSPLQAGPQDMIEAECVSVLDRARRRIDEVAQRMLDIPACPTPGTNNEGHGGLAQALRETQQERDHLKRILIGQLRPKIATLVPTNSPCETLSVTIKRGTDVIVKGRVRDLANVRRRISDAVRGTPGLTAETNGLEPVDVCGIDIGSDYVVEIDRNGEPRDLIRGRVAAAQAVRVPPPDLCKKIGSMIDETAAREPRLTSVTAFWIKIDTSAGPALEPCEKIGPTGTWEHITHNTMNRAAVLVLRRGS